MVTRSLLCLLIILLLNEVSFGQVSDQDKAEAVVRAKQFNQRLRRTQDIKPLLPEFFAPDFLDRIDDDKGHNTLLIFHLSEKQNVRLTKEQRDRYYLASMNLAYLAWTYNCWTVPNGDGDDVKLKDRPYPAGVLRGLEQVPILNSLLLNDLEIDEEDEEKLLPHNSAEVEILTKQIEQINALYRRGMRPISKMSNKRFERVINKCNQWGDFFETRMATCNDRGDCPGVQKGAPLIGVISPLFAFIDFARINGQMKIVRLFLIDESLI